MLPVTSAAAQPACAAGALTDYLGLGFACTIGPWRLADFFYVGAALDEREVVAAPSAIAIDPFAAVDAAGRRTFGFAFGGFEASVHVAGAADGIDGAVAANQLGFTIVAARPGLRLVGGTFDLGAGIAGDATAAAFISASAGAVLSDLADAGDCGGGSADQAGAVGADIERVEGRCPTGPTAGLRVGLSTSGIFLRDEPGAVRFDGHGGGRVDRATFIVAPTVTTPEPATLALLGGGLTLLAVGRRRRARRSDR